MKSDPYKIFWLLGLSGAGKSTIAKAGHRFLQQSGMQVVMIDGDEIREFFNGSLGFEETDRKNNIKSIAFAALKASQHAHVIVANICPYFEMRTYLREKLDNYHEIFVQCSIEECQTRDPKGIYKRYSAGKIQKVSGLDDRFDLPNQADLTIKTESQSVVDCQGQFVEFLMDRCGLHSRLDKFHQFRHQPSY